MSAIPAGYKQSEVGVIPEDWNAVQAGDIGRFRGGSGFPIKYQGAVFGAYPLFKVSDMNNEGNEIFMRRANNYVSEPLRKLLGATSFPPNSIVFAKVGAAVFLERKKILAQSSCLDNNMAAFVLDANRADYRFIHYNLLHTKLGDLVSTTALPSLSGGVLSKIGLPLPPLPEQRAIAAALSDVDALLAKLDQFIAKKRDLKQAAMQQLLTGQTRLPGFSGEWEVKRLGEVLRVRHGKSQHNIETQDGRYPILATGGEIGRTDTFLYDKPSVLIGRKGTIDKPQFRDEPFWTVDTLFYTEISGANSPNFLFYKFNMIDWRSYNEASGVPSLNASTIENIEINLAKPDEQTAIATVLSDMDAELSALVGRRDKTRALKQGMMQELLTGRIRLV
jgi:type I restriction enzyme S subunit